MSAQDRPVIPMRVGGVVADPNTQAPIAVLRGVDDPRLYLPIFIGGPEAQAISTALYELEFSRPMTHDLMASLLGELGCTVTRITVTDLVEGTFYAEISLADAQGHTYDVDARPSDSLALALRTGAWVYVAREVLTEAGGVAEDDESAKTGEGEGEPSRTSESGGREGGERDRGGREAPMPVVGRDVRLEDLDPELFGNYEM